MQAQSFFQSVHLKSGRASSTRKGKWHIVLVSTGKWSKISAEHVVTYMGVTTSCVNKIPTTMKVEEELYGIVDGVPGP